MWYGGSDCIKRCDQIVREASSWRRMGVDGGRIRYCSKRIALAEFAYSNRIGLSAFEGRTVSLRFDPPSGRPRDSSINVVPHEYVNQAPVPLKSPPVLKEPCVSERIGIFESISIGVPHLTRMRWTGSPASTDSISPWRYPVALIERIVGIGA